MKVAIYGMGIIGREVFKTLFEKPKIEIVALCDAVPTGNLAYLLNHDSIYHDWTKQHAPVEASGDSIIADGKEIRLYTCTDIRDLPLGYGTKGETA